MESLEPRFTNVSQFTLKSGSSNPSNYFRNFKSKNPIREFLTSVRKNEYLRHNTKQSLLVSLLTIALSVAENEIYYWWPDSLFSTVFRVTIAMNSLFGSWLVAQYYKARFALDLLPQKTNLSASRSDLLRYLSLELVVTVPFLPPYVNYEHKFYQINTYNVVSVDDFFVAFHMLKLYQVVKYLSLIHI